MRASWVLVSVVLMVAAGLTWSTYQDLDGGVQRSDAIAADAPKSVGAINILVMGLTTRLDINGEELPAEVLRDLNAGESDRGGYNANTLILLHVPNNGSPATAFSVPRDDYVDFAGVSEGPQKGKIKEAYGRAKEIEERKLAAAGTGDKREVERRGREAGRKAEVETVRQFLNVPIDHLVEISLAGFYDIAKALGGVDVCLNHATEDHFSAANFPAGRQHLNASQALSFVRQRHGLANGDLDRTHRQQAFLSSVTHQLKSDLDGLRGLFDVAKRDVVLDRGWDVLDFAKQAPNLTGGKVTFHTLPIQELAEVDGQTVNYVDKAQNQAIVAGLIGGHAQGATSTTGEPLPQAAVPAPTDGRAGGAVNAEDGVPCVD